VTHCFQEAVAAYALGCAADSTCEIGTAAEPITAAVARDTSTLIAVGSKATFALSVPAADGFIKNIVATGKVIIKSIAAQATA
jgi:hypothetical protein